MMLLSAFFSFVVLSGSNLQFGNLCSNVLLQCLSCLLIIIKCFDRNLPGKLKNCVLSNGPLISHLDSANTHLIILQTYGFLDITEF